MVDGGVHLGDPFIQEWTVSHPASGSKAQVELALEADTDGRLTVALVPTGKLGAPPSRLADSRTMGGGAVHARRGWAPP